MYRRYSEVAPPGTSHWLGSKTLGSIVIWSRRPVELVWGESDRFMSLKYAERMLAGLPRARLTTIEACGHIPQNECPQRFVETLLAVLESDPPPLTTAEPQDEVESEDREGTEDVAR